MNGYGERIRRAWRLYEADHGDVTVTQMVELLAAVGLKASRAQVSRWTNELQEPALAEFTALGRALGVRAVWLAFGEEPMYEPAVGAQPRRPIPMMPVDTFVPLPTPAERAARKKAEERKRRGSAG